MPKRWPTLPTCSPFRGMRCERAPRVELPWRSSARRADRPTFALPVPLALLLTSGPRGLQRLSLSMPTKAPKRDVVDSAALRARAEAVAFGTFRIDLRASQLFDGERAVPLRPKTWAVLLYLAERPKVLVTRDELLDAIWPDVAVTPDTLNKSIGELRLALGDDSRTPRFLETVHRRGFRFIASRAAADEPAPTPPPRRRWISCRPRTSVRGARVLRRPRRRDAVSGRPLCRGAGRRSADRLHHRPRRGGEDGAGRCLSRLAGDERARRAGVDRPRRVRRAARSARSRTCPCSTPCSVWCGHPTSSA